MATGPGTGGMFKATFALLGVFMMFRARRKRRDDAPPTEADTAIKDRRAAVAETERRMASYLAQSSSGKAYSAPLEKNEQEIRR